jgi:hypothetical protein
MIGAQGTSSGLAFLTHNGTAWDYRLIISTDGHLSIPEFVGGGDQYLGVDNAGVLVAIDGPGGGSSQWDDVSGGINYAGGNVGIGETSPGYPLTIHHDGSAIGVLNWNGTAQLLNGDSSKGFNFGYLTTGNYGVIGSQGSASGITIVTNDGSTWGHRMIFSTDGTISIPALAGGGDQLLGVNNAGTIVIGTGGGGFTDPMTTNGDIITRISGTSNRLAAGTSGYVLTSNGAGNNISWQAIPGYGQDAVYTVLTATTTNTTETAMTGSMPISNGEAGLLEITVYAVNSTNTGSWTRKLILPYRGTGSTTCVFETHTNIIAPHEEGSGMEDNDISYTYNGSGDFVMSVFGTGSTAMNWRAEIKKYSVFWSS